LVVGRVDGKEFEDDVRLVGHNGMNVGECAATVNGNLDLVA
jgi:hypothetical protein